MNFPFHVIEILYISDPVGLGKMLSERKAGNPVLREGVGEGSGLWRFWSIFHLVTTLGPIFDVGPWRPNKWAVTETVGLASGNADGKRCSQLEEAGCPEGCNSLLLTWVLLPVLGTKSWDLVKDGWGEWSWPRVLSQCLGCCRVYRRIQ